MANCVFNKATGYTENKNHHQKDGPCRIANIVQAADMNSHVRNEEEKPKQDVGKKNKQIPKHIQIQINRSAERQKEKASNHQPHKKTIVQEFGARSTTAEPSEALEEARFNRLGKIHDKREIKLKDYRQCGDFLNTDSTDKTDTYLKRLHSAKQIFTDVNSPVVLIRGNL